jgi:hypothetical protein
MPATVKAIVDAADVEWTLALNSNGTLADTTSPWFVVMKKR